MIAVLFAKKNGLSMTDPSVIAIRYAFDPFLFRVDTLYAPLLLSFHPNPPTPKKINVCCRAFVSV